MLVKKLPETDEERVAVLHDLLERETASNEDTALSGIEKIELRNFLNTYEGLYCCFKQSLNDKARGQEQYVELSEKFHMYLSHFIQVFIFAVQRGEIKSENLNLYGLDEANPAVPAMETEDELAEWGERIINAEQKRISRGGSPIYNPAIAKVIVHYDLFKESLYSLNIFNKNLVRNKVNLTELQEKADTMIWNVWTKVEEHYAHLPAEQRDEIYKQYKIKFHHIQAMQLNVFD